MHHKCHHSWCVRTFLAFITWVEFKISFVHLGWIHYNIFDTSAYVMVYIQATLTMCSNIGLVKETNCCLCSFAIYCLLRTNFVNLVKQADRDVRVQTFVLIFSSFSKLALYECTGVFQIVFRPFFFFIYLRWFIPQSYTL